MHADLKMVSIFGGVVEVGVECVQRSKSKSRIGAEKIRTFDFSELELLFDPDRFRTRIGRPESEPVR